MKTNIEQGSIAGLNKERNAGKMAVVAPITNLSNVTLNATRVASSWQAPFKKHHARAPVPTLDPLERESILFAASCATPSMLMTRSVSGSPDSSLTFALVPARWDKRIDEQLRRDATSQFHAVLCRALLSSNGVRANSEEDQLFDRLSILTTADQKSR